MKLTAKSLKVTMVLDPAQLATAPEPTGSRVTLMITVVEGGRSVTAEVATKSVRKARAAIAEHGAEGGALIVQGKLNGTTVVEAGLVAQIKVPKPAAATAGNGGAADTPAAVVTPAPAPAPTAAPAKRDGLTALKAAAVRRRQATA